MGQLGGKGLVGGVVLIFICIFAAYKQVGTQLMQVMETPTPSLMTPTSTIASTPTPIPTTTLEPGATQEDIPIFDQLIENEGYELPVAFYNTKTGERYMSEGHIKALKIIDCDPLKCGNANAINDLIGKANSGEWKAVRVQVGTTEMLYIHSSWMGQDPELGEVFRRIQKYDGNLIGVQMSLGSQKYEIQDVKELTRKDIAESESLSITQIFTNQFENQVIFLTCDDWMVPGLPTPKLVIQMVPIE